MTDIDKPATEATAKPTAAVVLPDHLSIDPRSPFYDETAFDREIGIRFNGKERFDVEEYCISEGFIKVPAGKTVDRKGRPLLIKLKGKVEAFYVDQVGQSDQADQAGQEPK